MILLCNASSLLALVTGGAQALAVQASWVDASGNTITPSAANATIAAATTTTIVGGPGASTQRNVKFLSVRNTDVTAVPVTVEHSDGATTVPLLSLSLQPNYTLFYEDASGWYVVDGNGGRQGAQGAPGTPGTNGTNGTNAGNTGSAVINFGAFPGSNIASVAVTGQTSILSTSTVTVTFMDDATSDHTGSDHQFAAALVSLTATPPIAGVGFTINALCLDMMQGTFNVRFTWN